MKKAKAEGRQQRNTVGSGRENMRDKRSEEIETVRMQVVAQKEKI